IMPSPGIEIVGDGTQWNGAMTRGRAIELPVTVRFIADGDWTLGAQITNQRAYGPQVSGAVLNVVAANGMATLGSDAHALMKASPGTAEALRALGIAPAPVATGAASGRLAVPAVASVVTGTVLYRPPEGNPQPVRGALVQITNAAGAQLALTGTSAVGVYSAAINADAVKVTVYSADVDGTRAVVFPVGQPTQRYILESPVTPVTGPTTPINITSAATQRGTPAAPSNDSLAARGFAAYDAMLTFWFHSTAMIGRNMPPAQTNFPESTAAGAQCGTSCYSGTTQQMYILREDAFDWDVLGHEFFHFVTRQAALRTITTSLGGFHTGGTAIGQNTRQNGTGNVRDRDEGMRLAWGEGVATAMSLLIQSRPLSTFAFPALLNINDGNYTDTEDASGTPLSAETPIPSDGFGSENSVMGLLWDISDAAQDSDPPVTDALGGVDARLLWTLINSTLPCNPCDRVDRFWTGITQLFGVTSSTAFEAAKLFVINKMGPKATAPADGQSVPGTAAPTFQWVRNGDPSPAHRNNHFFLAFSRDNFQSHRVLIPVPTLDATSYTPTDAEWAAVQAGGTGGQPYKWLVAADRPDGQSVPAGWFWYSNISTIVPRSLEATITWSPVGADVDLHLANPSGTDIAYYNRVTAWGFLDRDCITTCAQEIISVTSLPFTGTYRLFAHYYSDHGRGPATVRAVVKSGSQVLIDQTFVLGATGATRTIVTVPVNTKPTAAETASSDALDPVSLPPKKSP
ncbi:MAG: hypothetical protein LC791_09160, partial [Acidobacteria bacterium]|nr:hypothetical protein [Acidobacteriota bacterium]